MLFYIIICLLSINNEAYSVPLSDGHRNKSDIRIIIIGAGISGLGAGRLLHENGYNNVTILEGQNRIGGRIHTVPFGNGIIELGAQWIHGQGNNPTYQLGLKYNLVADPETDSSVEGAGVFSTDDGLVLEHEKILKIKKVIEDIKENIEPKDGTDKNGNIISAGGVFEGHFKKFLSEHKNFLNLTEKVLWAVFDWEMRYEIIDQASTHLRDLYDVSVDSYTSYGIYNGSSHVNWKNGYKTLLDHIESELPKSFIHLNKTVKHIKIVNSNSSEPEVRVTVDGQNKPLIADHVIVTSSIGYLRKHYKTLFDHIPEKKVKVIKTLGFGTVGKIYLEFEKPFWPNDTKGFQLYWTVPDGGKFPLWTRSISGFDIVRHQPNLLMAWTGGTGAPLLEDIKDDKEVINTLTKLLHAFIPHMNVTTPVRVIRTDWGHNPFILGSYSHHSVNFARTKLSVHELSDPLLCHGNHIIDRPCVLFAGEASEEHYYSTTHGGLKAGRRDAQRIIDYWKKH